MLNGQALVKQLLTPIATQLGATLEADLKVIPNEPVLLPLITFRARGGVAVNDRGTEAPTAWFYTLDLSWFSSSEETTFAMASATYDFVHAWNDPFRGPSGVVRGVGHASNVGDRLFPDLAGVSDIPGHRVVQYAGGFDLQLHDAPRLD